VLPASLAPLCSVLAAAGKTSFQRKYSHPLTAGYLKRPASSFTQL